MSSVIITHLKQVNDSLLMSELKKIEVLRTCKTNEFRLNVYFSNANHLICDVYHKYYLSKKQEILIKSYLIYLGSEACNDEHIKINEINFKLEE